MKRYAWIVRYYIDSYENLGKYPRQFYSMRCFSPLDTPTLIAWERQIAAKHKCEYLDIHVFDYNPSRFQQQPSDPDL